MSVLKHKDLIRGTTRRFRLSFTSDITGMTATMTWRVKPSDADNAATNKVIDGVLSDPADDGLIYHILFDLTEEVSKSLLIASYSIDYDIVRGTDVKTILRKINVKDGSG